MVLHIPVREDKYIESLAQIQLENFYPDVLELQNEGYFNSDRCSVLDNGTDMIMLYTAMQNYKGTALHQAMDMYTEYNGSYSYYWHGYVVILRVLCFFLNYSEIRFLNMILQFLLVVVSVSVAVQKKGKKYGCLIFSSYVLLMPIALGFSLQFSSVFYLSFLGCLAVLMFSDYFQKENHYLFFFLIQGMLTCFFDLLTYPLLSWGLPILFFLFVLDDEKSILHYLSKVVCSGLTWILGYGGFWYLKCLLANIVLDRDVLQEAWDEVFLRAGIQEQAVISTRIGTVLLNVEHYANIIFLLLFSIWLAWFLVTVLRRGYSISNKIPALLLIGFSPICWFWILTNHTSIHHFFTYRIFNITVISLLGCFICLTNSPLTRKRKKKELLGSIGSIFVVMIISYVLSGFWPEDKRVHNGECERVVSEITLSEKDLFQVDFQPTMKKIVKYGVYITGNSNHGDLKITLYDENQAIDSRTILFNEESSNRYNSFAVDWTIENGPYFIELQVQGEDAFCQIIMGTGESCLDEYGNCKLNGSDLEGQIVSEITYRYFERSNGKKLLLIMEAWIMVLLPVWLFVSKALLNEFKSYRYRSIVTKE